MLGVGNEKLRWLKVQVRDTFELFVLPGIAALFPWSWTFAIFRRIVKIPFLYRADALQALHNAGRFGQVSDSSLWLERRKLITLVDHADLFLVRTRSSKWIARHIEVVGSWPLAGQPGLLCTFHWGAGMWSLRHARQAGMIAHSLVAAMNRSQFKGRPVLYAYAKARVQTVSNLLGVEALDVSQSLRPVLKALSANQQVLAAIDVPADSVEVSVGIDILGTTMRVPRGLLRVAANNGLPVTLFTVGLDVTTGRRVLRLLTLPAENNTDRLVQKVYETLNQIIVLEPWAWHFWSQADRFFTHHNPSQNA